MFDLLVLVLISVLTLLYYRWYKYREYIKQCLEKYPGPATKPIIGNAAEFGTTPVETLKALAGLQDKYGPIMKLFVGPKKVYLIVSDPELTEVLLTSAVHITKGVDYDYMRPWLLNGILLSTGGYWQKRRKLITPTFHFKILDNFIPVFNNEVDVLIENLNKEVGKEAVNVHPIITAYALDSICETAMGTSVHAQTSPNSDYVQAIHKMCELYIKRKYSPWKSFNFLYQFSEDYKILQQTLNTIHGFTRSVIQKRRQQILQEQKAAGAAEQKGEDDFGVKKKTPFLDLLLKSGTDLTDTDILEEVETFMFAGHDTTANAMCFTIHELANNKHVQDKVINELHEIFGDDKNRATTMHDLNNMKYLEMVIKESLRKYPPVPFFSRRLTDDLVFKDTVIPKGVSVTIFTFHMHNNPKIFKNPEVFDPERFSTANIDKKNTFSFVPFSAGPRNCIGQKFAMLEMKLTLSKILRNFIVSPADSKYDMILSSEVILKSINGVSIRLEKRHF